MKCRVNVNAKYVEFELTAGSDDEAREIARAILAYRSNKGFLFYSMERLVRITTAEEKIQ